MERRGTPKTQSTTAEILDSCKGSLTFNAQCDGFLKFNTDFNRPMVLAVWSCYKLWWKKICIVVNWNTFNSDLSKSVHEAFLEIPRLDS